MNAKQRAARLAIPGVSFTPTRSCVLQRQIAADVSRCPLTAPPSRGHTAGDFSTVPTSFRVDVRAHAPQRGESGRDRPVESSGGTLPYREATELAECVRIMGEGSTEYCRQTVLGEEPQPREPPPPCDPTPLTRAQYLAEPGTSVNDFGLTTLSGIVRNPTVHTTRVTGGVRIDETDAGLPPVTSVFTAADTFTEGVTIYSANQGAECASGRYPTQWTILPDGARKIREAEIEHCADFAYAFDISIRRYADAVNAAAASRRVFPSQRAAEAFITRQVGAAPANWPAIFQCLAGKTRDRDGWRGYAGWHTPRPRSMEPRLSTNCAFARQIIGGASLPQVGQHPPSEIIKDCGERGGRVPAGGRRRP